MRPVAAPAAALCDIGPRGLLSLPVPQVTARDAGRYLTMGFVLAEDGAGTVALSAHRMLMIGPDRLGLWMLPSRQLREMAAAAHARGAGLPVSVNIGVPPSVAIASATSTAHLPSEWSKLSLAGALAGAPVALSAGSRPGVRVLSHAEIVVEGEILPETAPEALPGQPLGGSMPEFLGYDGHGQDELAVLRVTSVRSRPSAVFQAVVGPGREQSVILGLGGALTLALGFGPDGAAIHDLRFSHAGGGMLLLFVALGRDRPADLAPLAARAVALCPFTKTVVFVDADVDLACEEDVLWAMTTRAQLANDCHAIPGQRPMRMDPSQSPDFLAAKGTASLKCYVDATVPPALWSDFRRSFEPA
jgi:4-hydroxy-3-polyprenylbenzoate decarboxylase